MDICMDGWICGMGEVIRWVEEWVAMRTMCTGERQVE